MTRASASGPLTAGELSDDEVYCRRLRREAQAFLSGRGGDAASDGLSLYREIERAVARHLLHRDSLPPPDDPRPLPKRAGKGSDGFTAQAAWDLLQDYVTYHLFSPSDARIHVVLQQGRDLRGFRWWLVKELRRYVSRRIRTDESGRMRDSLIAGLSRLFVARGLSRWGHKPDSYWSERERTPAEAARILAALDVEPALDLALREIDEHTVPLGADRVRRLTSGWGPGERKKMATIVAATLSADVPGLGRATFIPERPLRAMLTRLIVATFPEPFSEPLYVPLPVGAREAEAREVAGVRRQSDLGSLGAIDAVLEAMDALTHGMPLKRSGGTSGSDVRRAVRLYFEGARSTRDGEIAWRAQPIESRGDRPMTMEALTECMPGGLSTHCPSELQVRLAALRDAFATAPASAPRSHATVNALRERCWKTWREACIDLDPVAEARALHWFVDLLFLEVGKDTPFASIDESALALLDRRLAERAARQVRTRLCRAALRPGFAALTTVLPAVLEGADDAAASAESGLPVAEVARLRLVGTEIVEQVCRAHGLLPSQRALAEQIVIDALRRGAQQSASHGGER